MPSPWHAISTVSVPLGQSRAAEYCMAIGCPTACLQAKHLVACCLPGGMSYIPRAVQEARLTDVVVMLRGVQQALSLTGHSWGKGFWQGLCDPASGLTWNCCSRSAALECHSFYMTAWHAGLFLMGQSMMVRDLARGTPDCANCARTQRWGVSTLSVQLAVRVQHCLLSGRQVESRQATRGGHLQCA